MLFDKSKSALLDESLGRRRASVRRSARPGGSGTKMTIDLEDLSNLPNSAYLGVILANLVNGIDAFAVKSARNKARKEYVEKRVQTMLHFACLEALWYCLGKPVMRIYSGTVDLYRGQLLEKKIGDLYLPLNLFCTELYSQEGQLVGSCITKGPYTSSLSPPAEYTKFLEALVDMKWETDVNMYSSVLSRLMNKELRASKGVDDRWFWIWGKESFKEKRWAIKKDAYSLPGNTPCTVRLLPQAITLSMTKDGGGMVSGLSWEEISELTISSLMTAYLMAEHRQLDVKHQKPEVPCIVEGASGEVVLPRKIQKHVLNIGQWVDGKPIRLYHPDYQVETKPGSPRLGRSGWKLTKRITRVGHWKNVHYGPKGALVKKVWINAYWAGPKDGILQTNVHELGGPDPSRCDTPNSCISVDENANSAVEALRALANI